jgi:hypothetical protein
MDFHRKFQRDDTMTPWGQVAMIVLYSHISKQSSLNAENRVELFQVLVIFFPFLTKLFSKWKSLRIVLAAAC